LNLGEEGDLFRQKDGREDKTAIASGDITLTPAGETRQWHWNHQANILTLSFSPQLITKIAQASELNDNIELINQFGKPDPHIHYLGQSLLQELKTSELNESLSLESLTNLLVIHLLRNYSVFPSQFPSAVKQIPNPRMKKVIDYLRDRLDQKITIVELAEIACLSPYHFSRLFRQETGFSPHQYLIRCRIEEAKRLLATRKWAIAEVAKQVGFADQSHLTRHFKQWVGMTPKAFIAQIF
jgi:AraC family transcriptional regulator